MCVCVCVCVCIHSVLRVNIVSHYQYLSDKPVRVATVFPLTALPVGGIFLFHMNSAFGKVTCHFQVDSRTKSDFRIWRAKINSYNRPNQD